MPCSKPNHVHQWPTTGEFNIERCEHFCSWCTGENAKHRWKFAWFLRRHVMMVHIDKGEFPNIVLGESWTRKDGDEKKRTPKKKAAARRARKLDTPEPSPSPSVSPPPPSADGKVAAGSAHSRTPSRTSSWSGDESIHSIEGHEFYNNGAADFSTPYANNSSLLVSNDFSFMDNAASFNNDPSYFMNNASPLGDGSSPFVNEGSPYADGSSPSAYEGSPYPSGSSSYSSSLSSEHSAPDFDVNAFFGVAPNDTPPQAPHASFAEFPGGPIGLEALPALDPEGPFAPAPFNNGSVMSSPSQASVGFNDADLAAAGMNNANAYNNFNYGLPLDHSLPLDNGLPINHDFTAGPQVIPDVDDMVP